MRQSIRRLIALILAMAMSLSLLSANAWAGEASGNAEEILSSVEEEESDHPENEEAENSAAAEPEEEPEAPEEAPEAASHPEDTAPETQLECSGETEHFTPSEGKSGQENLLLGYLKQQARGNALTPQAVPGSRGKRLTGVAAVVYQNLADGASQIAAGERASTVFTIPVEQLGLPQTRWTAEELGVTAIAEQGDDGTWRFTREAQNAAFDKVRFDFSQVLSALTADYPYECYWYDKTTSTTYSSCSCSGTYDSSQGGWVIFLKGSITIRMPVLSDYATQGAAYSVDTSLTRTASQAATRAGALVEQYKDTSDLVKLDGYRQEICNLVTYNHDAAAGKVDSGNPWQLIWVFDDDPDTNVVCEGYSKAFQFLCDLSTFRGDVHCRSVTGMMSANVNGNISVGAHMWNIVQLNDGKNYLVDVTNCDENSIGAPKQLFLAGASSGSVASGYEYTCEHATIQYTYDESMLTLFSETELTMATGVVSLIRASGTCGANLTWTLDKTGTLTISGSGPMNNLNFDNYSYCPWRDQDGVDLYSSIKELVIEPGVTSIGDYMFYNCCNMRRIVIPDSVTSIGTLAFWKCASLKSVEIPGSVTSIGPSAFWDCGQELKSVSIENGVTSIGAGAFEGCVGLTSIVIPDSVTSIGAKAFKGCTSLTDVTIGTGVETLSEELFSGCGLPRVDIPDSVKSIEARVFQNCQYLSEVRIPDAVTSIKAQTFENCSCLATVDIPASVNDIGQDAFNHTPWIQCKGDFPVVNGLLFAYQGPGGEIKLPTSVSKIGNCAFYQSKSLTSVEIGETVTEIGRYAFYQCFGLTKVALPSSLVSIGDHAFYDCRSLTRIGIPDSVTSIGTDALGYYWNESKSQYLLIEGFAICGDSESSYAASYAAANSIPFHLHRYSTPVWHWSEDRQTAAATFECTEKDDTKSVDAAMSASTTPGTCKDPAKTTYTASVLFDGQNYTDSRLVEGSLDKTNHTGETETKEKKEATCGAAGYTGDIYCLGCGVKLQEGQVIPATGVHIWDAGTVTTPATCTSEGVRTYTCAGCSETKTERVPALGHDYEAQTTPPTCTEQGFTTYTCKHCQDSYTADYVPAPGHDWDEGVVTKQPTEEHEGERTYSCKNCDVTRKEVIPAIAHHFDDGHVTREPACTEEGVKTFTCTDEGCGKTYTTPIPALGHNYEAQTTPPTCTEQGYTTYNCKRCQDSYTDNYTSTLSHDYKAQTTQPTCTEQGFTTYTCKHCQDSYTDNYTSALGHDYKAQTTAPTCTKQGFTTYTCKHCGEHYTADYVPAPGHTWDEGSVTTQPTTTTEGVKTFTCKVCGKTKTEPVAKLKPETEPDLVPQPDEKQENTITCKNITKNANATKNMTFKLNASANGAPLSYTSSEKQVTVKNGKVTIKKGFAGKATITITAAETDSYLTATKKVTVSVKPVTAVKVNKKKKVVTVSWTKCSVGKGYEVQIAQKKNFKKVTKKVKIKKKATASTAVKNLKPGTYFLRVRVLNGKKNSDWSAVKTFKIAK